MLARHDTPIDEVNGDAIEVLVTALMTLKDQGAVLADIEGNPEDDQVVERTLGALELIRDALNSHAELRRKLIGFRNDLVGAIVIARPNLRMKHIADSAGIDDSLATRVARERGAAPRTYRNTSK